MIHPIYVPAVRRLPPRLPCRRLVFEKNCPTCINFSYCSWEDVESLTKICYTFNLQSTGCSRPKHNIGAGKRLFQN